jgi:hypothetical protein
MFVIATLNFFQVQRYLPPLTLDTTCFTSSNLGIRLEYLFASGTGWCSPCAGRRPHEVLPDLVPVLLGYASLNAAFFDLA